MRPDSATMGYTRATRTEDPSDVDFNVGSEPLVGMGSKGETKGEEQAEQKPEMKTYEYIKYSLIHA
jgi:hypothetical protein